MKLDLKSIILFSVLLHSNSCKFFAANDKISVNLNYIQSCKENNQNSYNLNLSAGKYNRTHIGIYMNITVPELFDHSYELEFEARNWGDGGWKKNFVHLKRKNACATLYMLLGSIWTTIIDAAGCNRGCPAKPGYYYFKDIYFDFSNAKLIVQPGRFFLIGRILKNNIVPACLEAELEIKSL